MTQDSRPQVVIIGGGFGGLNVAKGLRKAPVDVTLVDKRNFHLFQPLLYQVATGSLSPGDIAHPLRTIFSNDENISVLKAEVTDIDPFQKKVFFRDGELGYDTLIVATGSKHHYFGHQEWHKKAPGLKTVEDALTIRRHILLAFEAAEREEDPQEKEKWLTFVIVGGGPTGVELAGALAELTYNTLKDDFQNIDLKKTKIILLEAMDRVLPPYPPTLSQEAEKELSGLGVTVRTNRMVTRIQEDEITIQDVKDKSEEQIQTHTVLWGAGMQASPLGRILTDSNNGAGIDKSGRVIVEPDLTVPGHPDIFVIGDLANFSYQDDSPLPGLAAVAMQEGQYVARLIKARLHNKTLPSFEYKDRGMLSIIGRNAAVANLGSFHLSGFKAWVVWVLIHIYYMIGFDNKVLVLLQWAWSYITYRRSTRLITNEEDFGLLEKEKDESSPNLIEPNHQEKTNNFVLITGNPAEK